MGLMKKLRSAFVLALLPLLAGSALGRPRVKVLTSIFPLEEFAAAVAGDRGEVSLLLPPGAGVHTWQPRPSDIMRLASSDLFVSVGSGLEPWLAGIIRAIPAGQVRVLEVSRGLALLPAAGEAEETVGEGRGHLSRDPHIWLDLNLDRTIVDRIVEALAAIDPENAGYFRNNAETYKERLESLDARLREGLENCSGRRMIIAGHAAFGYLAKRYGLVQTALYGMSPDSQATPGQMMKIIDDCRKAGIRTVFYENSVSPDLAKTLAAEIGGRVLVLSAGDNLTREEMRRGVTFLGLMEENLKSLRGGLGCR
jgi:zinc transport system substrate-binding protein